MNNKYSANVFICTICISGATLRDLCPQDKGRVRGLVEQLSVVMGEREQLTAAIREDRAHFLQLLDSLKSEHSKVREGLYQFFSFCLIWCNLVVEHKSNDIFLLNLC